MRRLCFSSLSIKFTMILLSPISLDLAKAADRYMDFYSMSAACSAGPDNQPYGSEEGDYHIDFYEGGGNITLIAIHGGKIELKTSEATRLMSALAVNSNYYIFNAHPKSVACAGRENPSTHNMELRAREMHVTASHFNDSRALELLSRHPYAVSIHGMDDGPTKQTICVGGGSEQAVQRFIQYVYAHRANHETTAGIEVFNARDATSGTCANLGGASSANIVNKASSGWGLQLEMSLKVRENMSDGANLTRSLLKAAISDAIAYGSPTPSANKVMCTGPFGYEVTNLSEESCSAGSQEVWRFQTKQWGKLIESGRTYFPCNGSINEGYSMSDIGIRYRTVRNGKHITMYLDSIPVLNLNCS